MDCNKTFKIILLIDFEFAKNHWKMEIIGKKEKLFKSIK